MKTSLWVDVNTDTGFYRKDNLVFHVVFDMDKLIYLGVMYWSIVTVL